MIDLGAVRPLNIISALALVSWSLSAGAIRASEDPPGKTPSGGVAGSWYGTLKAKWVSRHPCSARRKLQAPTLYVRRSGSPCRAARWRSSFSPLDA